MRHASRFIAVLIGCATYVAAAATAAYARTIPDGGVVVYPPSTATGTAAATGTPLWKFFAVAALGALLAIAIVGLVASLRHRRSTAPSGMLHA